MKKMHHVDQAHVSSLQHSLTAIRKAQNQLHDLTNSSITPMALAWQIDLCNFMLGEISGIHSNLAKHLENRRLSGPEAGEHVRLFSSAL